ncbi:WD repeat-containing protein 76-like [Glandiceps talaboti]
MTIKMIGASQLKRKRQTHKSSPQSMKKRSKIDSEDACIDYKPDVKQEDKKLCLGMRSKVMVTPLKSRRLEQKIKREYNDETSQDGRNKNMPRRSRRRAFTLQEVSHSVVIDNTSDIDNEIKKETQKRQPVQDVEDVRVKEKTSLEKMKEESESDSDLSEDDSEDDNGLSAYERKRLRNIEENAKFFASLGIFQAKENFSSMLRPEKKEAKKASQNGIKSKPKTPEPLPRRQPSLRLRGMNPDGALLPEVPKEPEQEPERHPRKPGGPMEMKPNNIEDKRETSIFENSVKRICEFKIKSQYKSTTDLDKFIGEVAKMTLTQDHVAKVVPTRIFSLAIHPSVTKTLVFAGGKWGTLGLWDVGAKAETSDNGVYTFEPHSRPINCLALPQLQPDKIYSCSYDGTVRCGDFNRNVFEEVCTATYGLDIWYSYLDFLSQDGSQIVVGQMVNREGSIGIVDTRTNRKAAENVYGVHNRSVKTVSVHPLRKHCVITASTDSTVAMWDIRNMKSGGRKNKALSIFEHGRGVTAAYFSPLTGDKVVTTAFDDRIRHDNHVGRWLTPFRAAWHPSREDIIISGSMSHPRRIEMYNDHCHNIHNFFDADYLGSVCSLNVFHPTRNILAGGNSSGRVHVFMQE